MGVCAHAIFLEVVLLKKFPPYDMKGYNAFHDWKKIMEDARCVIKENYLKVD